MVEFYSINASVYFTDLNRIGGSGQTEPAQKAREHAQPPFRCPKRKERARKFQGAEERAEIVASESQQHCRLSGERATECHESTARIQKGRLRKVLEVARLQGGYKELIPVKSRGRDEIRLVSERLHTIRSRD